MTELIKPDLKPLTVEELDLATRDRARGRLLDIKTQDRLLAMARQSVEGGEPVAHLAGFIANIRDHLRYLKDSRNTSLVEMWIEQDLKKLEDRLAASPPNREGRDLVEAVTQIVRDAYIDGATSVREYWHEEIGESRQADPDFGEVGDDYAASKVEALRAALSTTGRDDR